MGRVKEREGRDLLKEGRIESQPYPAANPIKEDQTRGEKKSAKE